MRHIYTNTFIYIAHICFTYIYIYIIKTGCLYNTHRKENSSSFFHLVIYYTYCWGKTVNTFMYSHTCLYVCCLSWNRFSFFLLQAKNVQLILHLCFTVKLGKLNLSLQHIFFLNNKLSFETLFAFLNDAE